MPISRSRARASRDDDPAGDYIPGRARSRDLCWRHRGAAAAVFGSIRVRHFGPRALIEDASVKSRARRCGMERSGIELSSRARLVLEVFNIFDAEVSDIDYFYASRLPGEPEEASRTFTRIRRCRARRGSVCSVSF